MSQRRLVILGAGRFAADVADWASEIPGVTVIGFFQDQQPGTASLLDGLPIFNKEQLRENLPSAELVCAVGSPGRVAFIEKARDWGARFATLIHPSARVSSKTLLAPGTLVAPLANVAAHSKLARHVIVNRAASVGHDVEMDDYVFLGPGCVIAGSVCIGRAAYIGAGAVIKDGLRIGAGAKVGIGSVAARDVAAGATVFGIPARLLPNS